MQLEPFKQISWAFQLHYHVCFRTHRRKTSFDDQSRIAALSQALTDLCKLNDLHMLEKDYQPEHVQLLLSLRPGQLISDALKLLKGRSSAAICQEFGFSPPLWARGYLARSAGRVRVQAVKRYLADQAYRSTLAAIGLRRNVWRVDDRLVEGFSKGSKRGLNMNYPPTALVGFRERRESLFVG